MSVPAPDGVPLFDADGALSREFLLRRGYCCENGCRNCPYDFHRQGQQNTRTEGDGGMAGDRETRMEGTD